VNSVSKAANWPAERMRCALQKAVRRRFMVSFAAFMTAVPPSKVPPNVTWLRQVPASGLTAQLALLEAESQAADVAGEHVSRFAATLERLNRARLLITQTQLEEDGTALVTSAVPRLGDSAAAYASGSSCAVANQGEHVSTAQVSTLAPMCSTQGEVNRCFGEQVQLEAQLEQLQHQMKNITKAFPSTAAGTQTMT